MTYAVTYAIALAVFLVLDFIWLGWIASGLYQSELGPLMAPKLNYAAAIAFYLIYTGGLMFFVIGPSQAEGGWTRALITGAAFGFVAYATYDLSNLATLQGWSWKLSLVDMVWGATLTGLTSASAVVLSELALRKT
jgi:uncharacterized membrane protein